MQPTLPSLQVAELPGIGAKLGPYRLVSRLGAGGMGEVFQAEHEQLGRKVAVKFLRPEYAKQPELVRRFFHEARVVNQIDHENIVQVFDFVEEPGAGCYLVMELLAGCDLATARKDGPFDVARAVTIARQVAEALAAAHRRHVVHRDLKPENVFLVSRGRGGESVKLLDFGLAKLSESMVGPDGLSSPGMVLGTPDFMAPEQAAGRALDGRADIYALGLLLHWMLSDDVPHRGVTPTETLIQRATQPPPPPLERSSSGEHVPTWLAELVQGCLAREPQERPQAMAEIADRLARLEGIELGAVVHWRRWRLAALGGGVALALALAAALWSTRDRPTRSAPPDLPVTSAPAPLPPPSPVPSVGVQAPSVAAASPIQPPPIAAKTPRTAERRTARKRTAPTEPASAAAPTSPDAPAPDALMVPR